MGWKVYKKGLGSDKGFTIVEAVISAAILAIGIVGIFMVIMAAYRTIRGADKEMIANYLVQDMCELLRSETIGNLMTFDGTDTGANVLPSQARERELCLRWKNKIEGMLGRGASGTISIEQNAPEPGVMRITVEVGYTAMGVRRTQKAVLLRAPVQ